MKITKKIFSIIPENRNALKLEKFILLWFVSVSVSFIMCNDLDGIKKKNQRKVKTDFLFLILAENRNKGNCLRVDTSSNIKYCDRRSRGLCNSNDLILTNSEKAFNIRNANDFVKTVPSCDSNPLVQLGSSVFRTGGSLFNSGILFDPVQTIAEEDLINANNLYSVVESCESTGITTTSILLTESELKFINSPKGRIGIAADKTNNTSDSILSQSIGSQSIARIVKADALSCLEGGFTFDEKNLISNLRIGTKVKAISCSTNSTGTNICP